MVQSYSLKSGLLLAIIFPVVNFYVCCKEFQPLKLHRNSLSKVGSQILSSQERIGSGGDRINANVAVQTKLTSLNYDEIQFAYGCLHDIPKPNVTLDTTFTPQQERNVLMEIFNQTAGHNWNNNTHWGNDSVSHCFWYGITCDHTNRYIINIILRKNNLTGTLPRSLWKLRNLQVLCIGNNKELSGDLREILSPNMTTILRLDLSHNRLSGIIPGEILVNMKSLVKIRLCCQMDDGLTGEIPMDIGNLTELQILSLGENRLYGSIPKSIAKLKKLWFLDLETATYLNSGFENLFNLSSLRFMHLSLAGLKGTLPDEFGLYFPEMIECLLAGNHFTGNIPSTMGNMTNLQHLNLARNHLSGEIPKCIGLIPTLQIVNFCGNQLSSFEKGIKFMSLEVLLLASNRQLTMSFNVLLEAMESTKGSLRILSIRDCNFLGTIPAMLWHFKNVIYIDLRNNRLTGKLPWSYENLLFLHDLHVSANNLSGQIPEPYVDLPSLEVLDVSENPYMHGSGTLPNYMRVDFTTLTRRHPSDQFKCPNARLNHNNGLVVLDPSYYFYSLCICDIGYYGSGKICLPCMEGAVCEDQMIPAQNMVMKMGFWPSSRHQNVSHLVDCSQALGTSPHINTSCNPTGACDCWIDNEWIKEGDMANIRPSTVCNKSCLCLTGSKDRFCSLCEDGYYKQGILCYACPKTEISVYILAALAVLTLVLITLTFFLYEKKRFLSIVFVFSQIILLAVLAMLRIIPGWLLELNTVVLFVGLAERGKTARGILKISLFYLQTLDALISNNDIWPIEALQTQRYISNVFNFRFSGLACVIPRLFTPLGELVSLVLLPVFCILGIWLWYGLGCLVCTVLRLRNLQVRRFRLRNTCLQLSIVSLNLTYFPIVKKTASVLARCGEDNNYHYLREAPWMECEGHVYTILQVLGWLAFVIYVIGVPLGVFLPLLRVYNVSTRDQLPPEEQETLDSWLGSIYLPYKKEFRSFFEIFFILKRMLIAFSLSLITRASSFQTIAVCFVLLVSLCFQLFFRPFNDSLENTVEALVLLTLHFSFMNIRYAVLNPDSSAPIVWMLVTVNLVILCGIVVSIIVLLGRKNAVEMPLLMHERAEDMELTPICQINSPLSSLVRNGPEEQYETFDDS
ncbi:hypothetical protein OS493_037730 [Desmophyllum pertusum]|uniref:Uncharacterized protein n=1 Tax=Desmophyllum pertusum TaxID=174260 RepID=A0A9X0CH05_9CNID|nr:hypothetical protein OS493_037730 [Desmophyllum pertusum]